jgi:hypothetical protein
MIHHPGPTGTGCEPPRQRSEHATVIHTLSSDPVVVRVEQIAGAAGPVQSEDTEVVRRLSTLAQCPGRAP